MSNEIQATGKVKALAKKTIEYKGTVTRGVLIDVVGEGESWFNAPDGKFSIGDDATFSYTINGKYKTITSGVAVAVPAPTKRAAASSPSDDSRQRSIVRQSSLRDMLQVYTAAGMFTKGMSREDLVRRVLDAVEDSQAIYAYSTVDDVALENIRASYGVVPQAE